MIKKILFIKPYRPDELFVTTPPLAFPALASYLRREAEKRGREFEFKIVDLNPKRQLPDDIVPEVLEYAPDLIGISCLSCEANASRVLTRTLKRHLPEVPIVLGGPYASHDPDTALRDAHVDFIVKGEGEATFDDLVWTLDAGGDAHAVAGIGYSQDGKPQYTEQRPFIADLDSLPLPAYDILDMEPYFRAPRHSRLIAHPEYMTVSSTRGCPYGCIYCHVTFGKKTRFRSAENVLAELELLVKQYGIKEIQWADDIWNLDIRRSKKICDLILERGLKIKMAFPNGVRGDLFDAELLDKMKAAGTYMITFAPETGSPRVQKFIKKNARLEKLHAVIGMAADRGIFCHGFFMCGFPTETIDDLKMTFEFARTSKLNTASFFIVNAHPGTKLYRVAKEMGLNVDFEASTHNYFNPNFQLSEVPTEKLRRMIRWSYIRFFTSPARILRLLRTTPHKGQLVEFFWNLLHRLFDAFRLKRKDIYIREGELVRDLQLVKPYNRS